MSTKTSRQPGGAGKASEQEIAEEIGSAVARLESIGCDVEFESEWRSCIEAFEDDQEIWQVKPRRLIRQKNFPEAVTLIDKRDFGNALDRSGQLLKADLLYSARAYDQAISIFDRMVARFPHDRDLRVTYAKRLMADGKLVRARRLLEPVEDEFPAGTQARSLSEKSKALIGLLTAKEGQPISEDQDARLLAMKHTILRFRNRPIRKSSAPGLGKLSLITGSLGPGGAERQLTRLAIELEKARRAGRTVGGIEIPRPVEIIVRSHGPEKENCFFLDDVLANDVALCELNSFDPVSVKALGIDDPELLTLLAYVPPVVNFGVKRLTRHLQEGQTDVASAWQDGACLFTALAALLAGVPEIQLVMRGLPPSMRRHLFRPEYEVLYRAMKDIPGVRFLSNSHAAANAYCDWLGLPRSSFSVVYNGVQPMQTHSSEASERMWDDFVAATPDATHTIGGVFRFDTDKQPNLWIRFAARYLKSHPDARFVVVGGGRLLDKAITLASNLGIAERVLFTGRSTIVGYWMSRMDVMVLLSRFEGLPNVLIEAQYLGVRVVTTPAGGAAECIMDGKTGRVLKRYEKPDLADIVQCTRDMLEKPGGQELLALEGEGRRFLDERFSVPKMLEDFVRCASDNLAPAREPVTGRVQAAA